MRFTMQKLSDLTGKAKKLMNSPTKKTIITTVAIAAVVFNTNPVAFAKNSNPSTNHYVNKTSLDTFSDKSIVTKVVSRELEKRNEKTVKKAEKAIDLKEKAVAIVIDEKPIAYLDSKTAAEDVLKKLKLQYVSEDQLNQFEARSAADTALPPLGQNETRILDLHFSNNVTIEDKKVTANQLLLPDQAVSLLQKGTLEESKYIVKEGDVLGAIASAHGLKVADIIALNPGLTDTSILNIGQELNVTVAKPFVSVVIDKEVNQQEAIGFQTEVREDGNMAKGDTKVAQPGQTGLQNVTYHLTEQNGAIVNKNVTKQEIIKQPVNQIIIKGTKEIPSRGEGSFAWPASGGYISSTMGYRWGKMHKGIDIARPSNLTIKAADNGVVVSAGWDNGGYGNKIVIDHQNGFRTVYAHLSSISVRAGQSVSKGSAIGVMGATGDATGVHLHFEVYKNGAMQNPLSYLGR